MILFCDGSSRGNPGPAGIGVFVADAQGFPLRRFGEKLPEPATSNEAEYHALIRGLRECLRLGAKQVEVFMDGDLVRHQLEGRYKIRAEHLQRLAQEARALMAQFEQVTLQRIESERNLAHTYANIASQQNRRWKPAARAVDIDDTQKPNAHKEVKTMLQFTVKAPTVLEPDVYEVMLVEVETTQGAFGKQIRFKFEVTEPDFEGAPLIAWANASESIHSKAVKWAGILRGEPFKAGEPVDLLSLVGKRARATVEVRESSDGRRFNRVVDLLPAKRDASKPKSSISTEELNRRAREEREREELDYDPFAEDEDAA